MRVLHISDCHGDATSAADAMAAASQLKVPVVHTGDMVHDYFPQGVEHLDMPNILPVIGNHDSINTYRTDPSGYHFLDKPSQAELRARYFDPYPNRGLIFPDANATWWHKDVDGCRIIGLDVTALDQNLASEITWLGDTLNDMPALILVDIGPRNLPYKADGFTDALYWQNESWYNSDADITYPGATRLSNIVFAHAERTNTPIAMLCGHEHSDGAIVYRGVPIVTVGSLLHDKYNSVYRSQDAVTSRLFANLVTFDSDGLTVQRIGADSRHTGSRAKMWAYSYREKRITAVISR